VGLPPTAIPASPSTEASGSTGKDASYQLLQPTSCHEHPLSLQLPSLRLAPFRPSRPSPCLHLRANAGTDTKPSTTTPDSRCRHLRPQVAAHYDGAPTSCSHVPRFRFPERPPVVLVATRYGVIGRSRVRRGDSRHPLSPAPFQPVSRPSRRKPEPVSTAPRQRRSFLELRVPSIGKSRWFRPLLALRACPLGPPLISRLGHREPASDMRSRTTLRARPKHLPVIHRSPRATCRLPTSAVGRPTNTPTSLPNLAADAPASRRAIEWWLPLRDSTNRVATGQGALCA
jgi:hypothetical protein